MLINQCHLLTTHCMNCNTQAINQEEGSSTHHVFWKAWRTCSGYPASFPLCWSSWRITGRWRFPGFKVLKKTPIYTVQRKIVKTTLVGEHVGIIFCCRKRDFSPCVLGCLGERLLQEPSYRICTCVRWVWCEFMEVEVSSRLGVLFLSKARLL